MAATHTHTYTCDRCGKSESGYQRLPPRTWLLVTLQTPNYAAGFGIPGGYSYLTEDEHYCSWACLADKASEVVTRSAALRAVHR